jgi:RND family efflux transporter MFP subunit
MRFFVAAMLAAGGCVNANARDPGETPAVETRHVSAAAIGHSTPPPEDRGFIGVIVAHDSVDLVAKTNGRIQELVVRLGDHVVHDQVLARLDAKAAQQELAMAEASMRAAQAELDKTALEASQARERAARRSPEAANGQRLFSSEEVADARYQEKMAEPRVMTARATVAERVAKVKQLRAILSDLDLKAPFDGTISARYVDSGAVVGPTTPILRIINPDDLFVRFAIPEDRAATVAAGQKLRIAIETMTDVPATVEKVAPEVDAASRMIVAEAKLDLTPAWKGRIRPGLAARAFAVNWVPREAQPGIK